MEPNPSLLSVMELNGWVSRAQRVAGSLIVLCDNKPMFMPHGDAVEFGNVVPPVYSLHQMGKKILALCLGGVYRVENFKEAFAAKGARHWRMFRLEFAERLSLEEESGFLIAGHMHDHEKDDWVTQLALHDQRGDFIQFVGTRLRNFKLRGLQIIGRPNPVGEETPLVVIFGNDSAFYIELDRIGEGTQVQWTHFANHRDLHDVCQCWTTGSGDRRKFDLWAATEHGLKCWDWGRYTWSNVEPGAFYSLYPKKDERGREHLFAAAENGLYCVPERDWMFEWEELRRPAAFVDLREGMFLARVDRKSRKSTLEPLFHPEH
ncbi:MAG: hypothetical protein U0136_12160 [Bdellovibrionota bacterium]